MIDEHKVYTWVARPFGQGLQHGRTHCFVEGVQGIRSVQGQIPYTPPLSNQYMLAQMSPLVVMSVLELW